mmetsp:Transcript_51804/g.130068  ORF Transcript_51804/g.130068 Transcript_51804/m.130068 type:complete len:84 (-) Transcript_51804:1006-1257(-)
MRHKQRLFSLPHAPIRLVWAGGRAKRKETPAGCMKGPGSPNKGGKRNIDNRDRQHSTASTHQEVDRIREDLPSDYTAPCVVLT